MGAHDAARNRYDGCDVERLTCYGCAHSAAGDPWPGRPSGERPCGFCIRNREVFAYLGDTPRKWYDGSSPVSVPMDCYHSLDMKKQLRGWVAEAEHSGEDALNRLIDLRGRLTKPKEG